VAFIDREYRTARDRRHRGVAGLSMGGYGAMALALSYPEVFSAAASLSGVLAPSLGGRSPALRARFDFDSLRASYPSWLWSLMQPAFGKDSVSWASRDPVNLASRLLTRRPDMMPTLRVDCGSEDFLLTQNRAFRDGLRASGGQLVYEEHAGGHSWDYWRHRAGHATAWLTARLAVP
jgi:S-formylglutathione hydrolase FrmB